MQIKIATWNINSVRLRIDLVAKFIKAVTVYPNSALVTREVDVPQGTGTIEMTVTPLPPTTINSSLYTEGSDGIRVLTTRFRSSACGGSATSTSRSTARRAITASP